MARKTRSRKATWHPTSSWDDLWGSGFGWR